MSKRNGIPELQDEDVMMVDVSEEERLLAAQDPLVRRKVRTELREIISDTTRNKAELMTGDVANLEKHLDDELYIFKNVVNAPEMALDAKVCSNMADLGKERTRSFMTDMNNFQTTEFTRRVRTAMITGNPSSINDNEDQALARDTWIQFGQQCQKYFKQSPAIHFMFGSFARGPPVKKPPIVRNGEKQQEKDNILTVPKKLGSAAEMQKKETTSVEVDKIHYELRKYYRLHKVPMCYFEFIINPESFGQSVENMFYTSFLVKDGFAKIYLDADKLPVIEPVEPPKEGFVAGNSSVQENASQSVIITLTKQDWRDIIATFDIKRCHIPAREARDTSYINRNVRPQKP